MGNCGVGFAPAAPDRHDWLIFLMEGVEDIPGAAMHEGITWGWESFPEYLDVVARLPHVIDVGAQVPHGALRAYVMGDRGVANEEATADDIARMAALVQEGLLAGALGFSTSRTLLHRSPDGVPMPGTFAGQDELYGIGRVLGRLGKGVFQVAGEQMAMPEEVAWMKGLASEIRRPVMFNLSQTDFLPEVWRELVTHLDDAQARDIPLYAQSAGRGIGILMCWEGTAHPFATHPAWKEIAGRPHAERVEALRDPSFRARMMQEVEVEQTPFEQFVTQAFHKMFPMRAALDYEPDPSESVEALAARTGRPAREIAYDLLMERDGRGIIYFPLFNYTYGDLSVLHTLHQHPRVRMGLSDGGAHCGAICDGGMPTFMLTHWTRDRTRGPRLSLEKIVKHQTSETAHAFGLMDRGVIAPGLRADLNVIDYANLRLERPEMRYDLPAGGRRLMQEARGYRYTLCAGQVIVEGDRFTGLTPGKLVRGSQTA
jgi:N-acyl-D-aspartate/D-glutamate deacylase